ncbi:MAG: type II secretion system protein [Verrucomicrobia bacterium]|nr:type II secretion system protein [Verrucomicrobiota bacterium]
MRSDGHRRGGFTLIEVTLGLTILILIFGVIFQLVQFSVMGRMRRRRPVCEAGK